MLTLSGAPDRVVSWSDFSVQHKKCQKAIQGADDGTRTRSPSITNRVL